jgi:hypothetical protein
MSLLSLSCQGTSVLIDTSLHTVRQKDRPTIHANLKRAAKDIVVLDKGSTAMTTYSLRFRCHFSSGINAPGKLKNFVLGYYLTWQVG